MAPKNRTKARPRMPVKVTRKFLTDFANRIYDPKTHKFVRLCVGMLQSGLDEPDKERPLHCALGELYFAMTGKQPMTTWVKEAEIVDLAIELSPLNSVQYSNAEFMSAVKRTRVEVTKAIEGTSLPSVLKDKLCDEMDELDDSLFDPQGDLVTDEFAEAINALTSENDTIGDPTRKPTVAAYRKRAIRVRQQLLKAAQLLPE